MTRILALAISASLSLSLMSSAPAQAPDTTGTDTLAGDGAVERLLEATVTPDDSPLLDFLPDPPQAGRTRLEVRSRIAADLQQSDGYRRNIYLGSPLKSYQRIKFSAGRSFSGGILLKKDPGEIRFDDRLTGNISIDSLGPVDRFVLGDYFVEAGQGLALWQPADFSKGSGALLAFRPDRRSLHPALSSGEGVFRGIGAEASMGPIGGCFFYSQAARSASLDGAGNATAINASGYYRTMTEIAKRGNLLEKVAGTRLTLRAPHVAMLGLSAIGSSYSRRLLLGPRDEIVGDRFVVIEGDCIVPLRSLTLFGEWAASNLALAWISGMLITPDPALALVAAVRRYPPGFVALHGLGFGETGANEHGFYFGMQARFTRHLRCSFYYDRFAEAGPGLNGFPAAGDAMGIEFEWTPVRRMHLLMRYSGRRQDLKAVSSPVGEAEVAPVDAATAHRLRIRCEYHFSRDLDARLVLDRSFLSTARSVEGEQGIVVACDITHAAGEWCWLNVRIAQFRSDSFAAGMAEYERDLPGLYASPVLYGSGVRWYLVARVKALDRLELSVKYSVLLRDDVRHIGTGYDKLSSNHDSRIGIQTDFSM